jgi:hypothetical protein
MLEVAEWLDARSKETTDFTDTTDNEEVAVSVMLSRDVNTFTCPTYSVSVLIREIRGSHFSI